MRAYSILTTFAWLCAGFAMSCWSQDSDATRSREDQIKAGYLFNFAKFVDWPASVPNDSLTVCFIGAEGIQSAFEQNLNDKRVGSRRLAVRALHEPQAIDGCNVLFVDSKTPASTFARFGSSSLPILTVGDDRNFTQSGGIISLYTESNRLRFIVNVQNAARAKLHISSNLLQLASSIEKGDVR
jgi:uncharacterized protein DUF4154